MAIIPAECAWAPFQSGLGCILLSSDLVAGEGSIEGAMEAVAALAAAAARQFFGVLMLPPVGMGAGAGPFGGPGTGVAGSELLA